MEKHGLSNLGITITLSKSEYEALVRDSECLEILRNLYTQNSYFNEATVKTILGLEPVKESEDM